MNIHEFRDNINEEQQKVINYLKKKEVRCDYWGILCSCMDWIQSSMYFLEFKLNNQLPDDVYMYYFYARIACYDNLVESINQMTKLIDTRTSILQERYVVFLEERISFKRYLKEIRAIFGAHPTNLHIGTENVQCYASWPAKNPDGSMCIILYRTDRKKDIFVTFSINEFEFIRSEIENFLGMYCNELLNLIND